MITSSPAHSEIYMFKDSFGLPNMCIARHNTLQKVYIFHIFSKAVYLDTHFNINHFY